MTADLAPGAASAPRAAAPASGVEVGAFVLTPRFPGQSDAAALGRARDVVRACEFAGLDQVWFAEHHFIAYGVCPSAITFAAWALGATDRIRVGTAISILSTQHPVALGEQVNLLDHLSGGRLELGVGRGGPWMELEVLGTGLDRYDHGFDEALDLLLRWMEERAVAGDGPFFPFREVTVVPRPLTDPRPPVLVAATSDATVARAAARGLPLLLGMHVDDAEKRRVVQRWRHEAARHGHDPDGAPHASAGVITLADRHQEAVDELRASLPTLFAHGLGGYRTVDGRRRPARDHHAYTEFLCATHPVGTPDACVERLLTSAERTGIRRVALLVEASGDRTRTLETVRRIGDEVMPALRR